MMLNFIFHPHFEKEAANLKRRFPFFDDGLESFKRICEVHFDPILASLRRRAGE